MPMSKVARAKYNLSRRKGYRRLQGRNQIVRMSRPLFNSIKNTQKSYFYKYKISKGTVGIGNGQPQNYNAISFNLRDINNYSELTSLYDEYCISKVVVEFIPRGAILSQAINTATTGNTNQLYGTVQPFITVIDYDDATAPTTRNELLQYGTCKVSKPHTYVKRVFTPKIAIQTYKTAVSSGYMAKGHQWLDCADDTVPHYGLKWAWDQDQNAVSTTLYDIYCTYYVKFRGVR